MNRNNDIDRGIRRMENLAQQLLQTSYEVRQLMIKEAGVSTSAEDHPLSEEELAAISAKRRSRIMGGKNSHFKPKQ